MFQTAARLSGCLYSAVALLQQLLIVEMSASGPHVACLVRPTHSPLTSPQPFFSSFFFVSNRMQSVSSASTHFAALVTRNRCILAIHKMPLPSLNPMK